MVKANRDKVRRSVDTVLMGAVESIRIRVKVKKEVEVKWLVG